MNIVLFNSEDEGRFVLTELPSGEVVLRVEGSKRYANRDYAPSDLLNPEYETHAASIVHSWAVEKFRTDEGVAAAQAFLRQTPDGLQAEADDIRRALEEKSALLSAAEELDADSPTLDQMSAEQLSDYIASATARLRDLDQGHAKAHVLETRLNLAKTLLRTKSPSQGQKAIGPRKPKSRGTRKSLFRPKARSLGGGSWLTRRSNGNQGSRR